MPRGSESEVIGPIFIISELDRVTVRIRISLARILNWWFVENCIGARSSTVALSISFACKIAALSNRLVQLSTNF